MTTSLTTSLTTRSTGWIGLRTPIALLALLAFPRIAEACPVCAQRNDVSPYVRVALLGAMIVLPFVVFAVVSKVIRNIPSGDASAASEEKR